MVSFDNMELVNDSFRICQTLTESQRKDLLIVLLADMLKNEPKKAMNYVVQTKDR